jgi:hypothetical protein
VVLGIAEDNFIWSVGKSLAQSILAALNTFLSTNQPLMSRLLNVCLRAASSKRHITSQIFSTVVKFLRGVETNHILLIDYPFNKYPEILRIRSIRNNMVKYDQALGYLASIPENERLYVKIMRPRSDTGNIWKFT